MMTRIAGQVSRAEPTQTVQVRSDAHAGTGALAAHGGLTVVCWAVFGVGLAGFVPLTALVPSLVSAEDRGSALALYTLAAGLSSFVGPALVGLLGGTTHIGMLIWIFAGMYAVGALLSLRLKSKEDPVSVARPAPQSHALANQ